MNDQLRLFIVSTVLAVVAWFSASGWFGTHPYHQTIASEDAANSDSPESSAPDTVGEARGRAQLLHEMIHGSLQVMHRDFFREDEGLKIPSRSLDDVFLRLADRHQVDVRWLAVNAEPMSVDHKPQDDFEHNAVKALASGKSEFDAVEGESFRFAGLIQLHSQCLKCHVPRRTSNKVRAAAVSITMPLKLKK